mgnify:CR=1 FL=1
MSFMNIMMIIIIMKDIENTYVVNYNYNILLLSNNNKLILIIIKFIFTIVIISIIVFNDKVLI